MLCRQKKNKQKKKKKKKKNKQNNYSRQAAERWKNIINIAWQRKTFEI